MHFKHEHSKFWHTNLLKNHFRKIKLPLSIPITIPERTPNQISPAEVAFRHRKSAPTPLRSKYYKFRASVWHFQRAGMRGIVSLRRGNASHFREARYVIHQVNHTRKTPSSRFWRFCVWKLREGLSILGEKFDFERKKKLWHFSSRFELIEHSL